MDSVVILLINMSITMSSGYTLTSQNVCKTIHIYAGESPVSAGARDRGIGLGCWAESPPPQQGPVQRRYLSVREGVVVDPHLRVYVLQVPFKAAAF